MPPPLEPVRETAVIQTPEEDDALALPTNGQTEDAAYDEVLEEGDEEEELETPGSEPEVPLDEAAVEPSEPGNFMLTFEQLVMFKGFVL